MIHRQIKAVPSGGAAQRKAGMFFRVAPLAALGIIAATTRLSAQEAPKTLPAAPVVGVDTSTTAKKDTSVAWKDTTKIAKQDSAKAAPTPTEPPIEGPQEKLNITCIGRVWLRIENYVHPNGKAEDKAFDIGDAALDSHIPSGVAGCSLKKGVITVAFKDGAKFRIRFNANFEQRVEPIR